MTDLIASLMLIMGFALLGTTSSLLIIYSKGFVRGLAIILMVVIMGYGLVLYDLPAHYMGWASIEEPADGCFIRDIIFVEPHAGDPGAIYLLGFVEVNGVNLPRLYKLEYTREAHELLAKKRGEARTTGGLLQYRRGKKGSKQGPPGEKDDSGYRVIAPFGDEQKDRRS